MNNPIFNLMSMQTSPLLQLVAAMRGGNNPIAALSAINPQMAQQLQGKSSQELEQMVRQECLKRGMNVDALLQQLRQSNIL